MDNFQYYTVVGANGAAVMGSWNRAQAMRQYIRRPSYKGFNDFQVACDWQVPCLQIVSRTRFLG